MPTRPLPVIEAELDLLEKDTQQKETALIENYIEVGRRLEEVKAQLPHGEWGPWLENRGYPQAKAVKLMKVFRAYGKEQQSLFGGNSKSQAFANLGFHKLVQLLAIENEEDREQFVAERDVESMSTRELDKALREREAALQEAAAAKAETEAAKDAQAQAAARAQRLQEALSEANAAAQTAEEEHARLRQELDELRSRPVDVAVEVDTEAVEAARKAAIDEMTGKVNAAKADEDRANAKRKATEEALAAVQKKLDELKSKEPEVRELTQEEKDALTAEAVSRAKAENEEQIRSLEKQLAAADPNVAEFKLLFTSWQETGGKMMDALDRIALTDVDRAARFRQAVKDASEQMA